VKAGREKRKRILSMTPFLIRMPFFLLANSYAASTKEEYELQERCGKRAEERFKKEYGSETTMSNYSNHYNRKLNKCFILVTQTIHNDKETREMLGISTIRTLVDINENKVYGGFFKFSGGVCNAIS
jgi:hypothetical protein